MNKQTCRRSFFAVCTVCMLLPLTAGGAEFVIPMLVHHQGVVTVKGEPFSGEGLFRFAIFSPERNVNVWTNDGANVETANPPESPILLEVVNGMYYVLLGDPSLKMPPLTDREFGAARGLHLRVWFDDGKSGMQLLQPDQPLTSTPYAYQAMLANRALTADNADDADHAVAADSADNADTVDGVHAADLEESSEIDQDIALHNSSSGAHQFMNVSANQIASGTLSLSVIPQGASSGLNADKLDGLHATEFMRSVTDLWVNTTGDTMSGNLRVNGKIGVGTSPLSPLHLSGGNWDVGNTNGDLMIGSGTHRLKVGVATAGGGAGDVRMRAIGGTNRLILGSGTADVLSVQNGNVANAGDYKYTSPRTFVRQFPVSGFTWKSSTENDTYHKEPAGYIHTHAFESGNGQCLCPVQLPQGAVVKKLTVYYYDNRGEYVLDSVDVAVSLVRRQLNSTSIYEMANVRGTTTDAFASPSILEKSTTAIGLATIDNVNCQYQLYVSFYLQDRVDEFRWYGCSIEYTLDSLQP